MRSGQLRHIVTLQRLVELPSAVGQLIQTWVDVQDFYARVTSLAGQEAVIAQQKRASATDSILMRHPGLDLPITPKDRFLQKNGYMQTDISIANGGRVLHIVDVEDRIGNRRMLYILAEEVK